MMGEHKANIAGTTMPSSTALRQQIENHFQHRYHSVLSPAARTIREVATTGIAQIDALLDGGLPVGAISEITGSASTGRTTIALSLLARLTQNGAACAWIDTNDNLDPESAAANGVRLNHLLWVRCRNKSIIKTSTDIRKAPQNDKLPWTRLEQAICATDLLLQAGGFAAIVFDLANEAIEHGHRIPMATWFRFRQTAERSRSTLIVLGKASYAKSSADIVLECKPDCIETAMGTVIVSFHFKAQRGRMRFDSLSNISRKPPVSTWSTQVPWSLDKHT